MNHAKAKVQLQRSYCKLPYVHIPVKHAECKVSASFGVKMKHAAQDNAVLFSIKESLKTLGVILGRDSGE